MGYLVLTGGAGNMNKCTISVFFKIPAAAAAAVISRDASIAEDIAVMDHVVPILMFGTQSGTLQQSCIGVVHRSSGTPNHNLYVHLQPSNGPVCANTDPVDPDTGPESGAIGNSNNYTWGPTGGTPDGLATDTVHHLLISWELGTESAVGPRVEDAPLDTDDNMTSATTMYCAVNDVNKDGDDMPANWAFGWNGSGDPNNAISGRLWLLSGLLVPNEDPTATATMDYGTIPSAPLWVSGAPSISTESRGTIAGNQNIILAELQIYCGVLLDTSNASNRRAFIRADGTPETDFTIADALMGKTPEVRITRDTNWKVGNNSGTAGNFTKTGTLNSSTTVIDITP